jgi:hypothetical protein
MMERHTTILEVGTGDSPNPCSDDDDDDGLLFITTLHTITDSIKSHTLFSSAAYN